MVVFALPHTVNATAGRAHNWLWYSHGDAPTDRQVITGWQDPQRPAMRMARHYFLTDQAHNMLPGGYDLWPQPNQMWELRITEPKEAAMFKLMFL